MASERFVTVGACSPLFPRTEPNTSRLSTKMFDVSTVYVPCYPTL